MNIPARKLDTVAMVHATDQAAHYAAEVIRHADDIRNDPRKADREAKGECPACFYLTGRAGGASFTHQPCALCGVDQSFPSTCTDVLCLACANGHDLCRHCGGDRRMRVGRRKWPSTKAGS